MVVCWVLVFCWVCVVEVGEVLVVMLWKVWVEQSWVLEFVCVWRCCWQFFEGSGEIRFGDFVYFLSCYVFLLLGGDGLWSWCGYGDGWLVEGEYVVLFFCWWVWRYSWCYFYLFIRSY